MKIPFAIRARMSPINIVGSILPILFCMGATNGFAQADSGPPATIVTGLKSGDEKTQAYLARLLGLKQSGSGQNFTDCDIRADATKLDARDRISVLQVWCESDLNIVILKEHSGLSEVLDSRYFYATHDRSRVELDSLIRPSLQQIVIHNVNIPSGNIYQSHFLVLHLVKGHLEVVFSGVESGVETRAANKPRKLSTTFTVQPASEGKSGRIDEKTVVEVGAHSYVVRRSFGWSDDWQAFIEDGVVGIEATEQSQRH